MLKKRSDIKLAVCVSANGDQDLEVWKVYRVLPDAKAAGVDCLRVVDESGEDYLYPADQFVVLKLPDKTRERLLAAVTG